MIVLVELCFALIVGGLVLNRYASGFTFLHLLAAPAAFAVLALAFSFLRWLYDEILFRWGR